MRESEFLDGDAPDEPCEVRKLLQEKDLGKPNPIPSPLIKRI